MEKETLKKKFLDLLKQQKLDIKGKNQHSGIVAESLLDENENSESKESIIELKQIIKGLIGLGVTIIAAEGTRKLIGILKAIGEAAMTTQDMAIDTIHLNENKIEFNGYCLDREKDKPSGDSKLIFDYEIDGHFEIDQLFGILNKDESEFWNFMNEIDTVELLKELIKNITQHSGDSLEKLAIQQFNPTQEYINKLEILIKSKFRDKFIQSFIWKMKGDYTLAEMVESFNDKIEFPDSPLFTIHVSNEIIPYNLHLSPNFPPELIINKYLEITKSINFEVNFNDEKEKLENKLNKHIIDRKKEYIKQVNSQLEMEKRNLMAKEEQYLEIAAKLIHDEEVNLQK